MKWFFAVFIITSLFLLAWHHSFIQDDAFISFRYAKNLAEGRGLAWNPGERVEGYTNFLWVLICALGIKLGMDPVRWTQVLGLILYLFTLILYYRIGLIAFNGWRLPAMLHIVLTGTNFSFMSYATGGMETPLVTFLLALAVYLTLSGTQAITPVSRWLLLSVILGLGFLTRMDFAVFAAARIIEKNTAGRLSAHDFNRPFSFHVSVSLLWRDSSEHFLCKSVRACFYDPRHPLRHFLFFRISAHSFSPPGLLGVG